MQTITHDEARFLIHCRADQMLDGQQKEILNTHLKDCVECAAYAHELQEMETTLQTTLRKHWYASPVTLQVTDIKVRSMTNSRLLDSVATRRALIGVALLFFVFVYSQFTSPSYDTYHGLAVGISPIPTPSLPLTSTQSDLVHCPMVRYEVREGDTLQSLARQFNTSKETIIDLNELIAEASPLPTMLVMPLCEQTPTGTSYPPASTPNTPALETITYTPG